jgi:hypothetical protein
MRAAVLILGVVIVLGVVAYRMFFPRDSHFIFSRRGGGTVTFSRSGISFESAPDHYASNGFDHLEPYIAKLLVASNSHKFLHFFTSDGKRGFGFAARDGVVEAFLTIEWREEAQREKAIRDFFASLSITPFRDFLAGNGGVPDAMRVLEYRVSGSTAEVTALAKRILQELCGISASEALDIKYGQ